MYMLFSLVSQVLAIIFLVFSAPCLVHVSSKFLFNFLSSVLYTLFHVRGFPQLSGDPWILNIYKDEALNGAFKLHCLNRDTVIFGKSHTISIC